MHLSHDAPSNPSLHTQVAFVLDPVVVATQEPPEEQGVEHKATRPNKRTKRISSFEREPKEERRERRLTTLHLLDHHLLEILTLQTPRLLCKIPDRTSSSKDPLLPSHDYFGPDVLSEKRTFRSRRIRSSSYSNERMLFPCPLGFLEPDDPLVGSDGERGGLGGEGVVGERRERL